MSSSPDYLAAIAGTCDFFKFERIVDVDGGYGLLLARILFANPRLWGALYDLPAVVADASAPQGLRPTPGRCPRHNPQGWSCESTAGLAIGSRLRKSSSTPTPR